MRNVRSMTELVLCDGRTPELDGNALKVHGRMFWNGRIVPVRPDRGGFQSPESHGKQRQVLEKSVGIPAVCERGCRRKSVYEGQGPLSRS